MFGKMWKGFKERFLNKDKGQAFEPKVERFTIDVPSPYERKNAVPATPYYLKTLFPKSIFRTPITEGKRDTILRVLRKLRPDQLKVVYAMGWDKGVQVR